MLARCEGGCIRTVRSETFLQECISFLSAVEANKADMRILNGLHAGEIVLTIFMMSLERPEDHGVPTKETVSHRLTIAGAPQIGLFQDSMD